MSINPKTHLDDSQIREGAEILARWMIEAELKQQPARVLEVRPNSLEVKTSQGEVLLLPRYHSVRWSQSHGAFPLSDVR